MGQINSNRIRIHIQIRLDSNIDYLGQLDSNMDPDIQPQKQSYTDIDLDPDISYFTEYRSGYPYCLSKHPVILDSHLHLCPFLKPINPIPCLFLSNHDSFEALKGESYSDGSQSFFLISPTLVDECSSQSVVDEEHRYRLAFGLALKPLFHSKAWLFY